jgi:hypothetical protein
MHAQGADLPIEDCEFVYPSFCSDVFYLQFQIPTYAAHFHSQDLSYMFWWHGRFLKLLQSGYKRPHWLLKNPTHMDRIPRLLEAYPDGKIIFMHRDPVVSADSVTNIMGTLYWQRTDDPWSLNMIEDSIMAQGRARMWENIIGWIDDGTISTGAHTHLQYQDLCERPMEAIERCYDELGLTPTDGALDAMRAYLQVGKPKGVFGAHTYDIAGGRQDVIDAEREMYRTYQEYFGVPSEA